jgi:hypothetical protein
MEYVAYLRAQAEKFRELAEAATEPVISHELQELATICEQAATEIEDRLPSG